MENISIAKGFLTSIYNFIYNVPYGPTTSNAVTVTLMLESYILMSMETGLLIALKRHKKIMCLQSLSECLLFSSKSCIGRELQKYKKAET